jgi:hypothetical protein
MMTSNGLDYVNLTRICEFARLHELHRLGARTPLTASSAPCAVRSGVSPSTTSPTTTRRWSNHAWLGDLTRECATDFAAEQGYDLDDYTPTAAASWWACLPSP